MLGIFLGCVIFFGIIVWMVAEIVYHTRKLRAFFHRLLGILEQPSQIDVTMNQMYGDVHLGREAREGSNYRKARHAIKGG